MTLEDLRCVWEGDDSGERTQFDGVIVARRDFGQFPFRDPGGGAAVLDRPDTDTDLDTGSGGTNDDWVVLKGKPWSCGCGASSPYMAESEQPHRIIVWPSPEDPNLAKLRERIKAEDGEETSVVPYEKSMGPCISHYEKTPS